MLLVFGLHCVLLSGGNCNNISVKMVKMHLLATRGQETFGGSGLEGVGNNGGS